MRSWITAVLAVAALAFAGCGSDSDSKGSGLGGGGKGKNPCVEDMFSEACFECSMALAECMDEGGACHSQTAAYDACVDRCSESDVNCCNSEARAVGSCLNTKCKDGAACFWNF